MAHFILALCLCLQNMWGYNTCMNFVCLQMLHSTLIGAPGAPDVRLRMVNSELIVLEWDTPFTWNHTTIEHYKITSSNPHWTHTMYTDTSLQLQRSASATECAEYTFTVLANNGVEGEATTISGGFPIGKR